ncbi:MAG: acyl-ACP--UDP-N-acetylglucosamine O-acyltransferase [Candidatus Omnitrophica bacterium]|nr:acyl-ACP--UDP-N-acetylglucosamine O-acyltransferase [Candidatus Omnitrophota bacterium]
MSIHPTAIVSEKAEIAPGVEIGPYSVIGPEVKIGEGTRIGGHVVVEGATRIGARCRIGHGACLGTLSQDKKMKEERSVLVVGDDNIFREHVTVNGGHSPHAPTVIGNKNFIMIGCHVAHECVLGNEITMSNNTVLAGHVAVEDHAVISGLVGVHQFVRIGKFAMIGGLSKAVMDIPPFSVCDGHPASFYGVNAIGLKRAGFKAEEIFKIKKALKTLFASKSNLARAVKKVQTEFKDNENIRHILSFIENSKRGICRAGAVETGEE